MTEFAKVIGTILAAVNGSPTVQTGPMTLDQALDFAETNAFAVQLQQSAAEKSRQQQNQARSNLGPQISLGANYTRFDQQIEASLGPGTPPLILQPISEQSAQGTLTWQLDIAGNGTRLLHATEHQHKAAVQNLHASLNDTRLAVREAYFNVLRSAAQVDVESKALEDAQGRLDQGQKQFAQQQVALLDVTRYKAAVASSTSDLLSAKDSLVLADYAFNQTLARPIETKVQLVDMTDLPTIDAPEYALVKAGQANRPEVLSAQENLKALALIRRATEQGWDPSLLFELQYIRQIDPVAFTAFPEQTIGTFTLSFPIFDSGLTRAKVNQARQDEVTARVGLEQTELQISSDVRSAIANLTSAKARLDNAVAQLALAEEVFRLAKVKQDAGAGTYYEVIDAESQLTTARSGVVSARYDYLTSYSQLQRAVGTDNIAGAAVGATANSKGGR